MSSPVIEVNGLGKKFVIEHQQTKRQDTLRDTIIRKTTSVYDRAKRIFETNGFSEPAITKEEFWALKDVNFRIEKGDRVGIIGRNGAGKSTLLKLLSRVTEPTSGSIVLRGKVASLLEVGTGFHPELSGRENIFLNGAILGMSRAEIKRKFDEIVDFAEIEKFLDTPVKRYSSGMYVRLAFAVAAHLEPEILIIDEILSVGDSRFQKKCIGKMEEVSEGEGRTILFVSHNLTAVKALCNKGILLEDGTIRYQGSIARTVDIYKEDHYEANSFFVQRNPEKLIQISKVDLQLKGSQPFIVLVINLAIINNNVIHNFFFIVDIINSENICIYQTICRVDKDESKCNFTLELELPGLVVDIYTVNIYISSTLSHNLFSLVNVLKFEIDESPTKEKMTFNFKGRENGLIYPVSRLKAF